ncbi:unnamed protein product [Meloidogyne enterolobii]|uniref:Uncharacterized protein n=2 Tax=Meloidogyne enterolobii TaxID=390850 RepID=A0ACB1B4I4_MELEN
MYSYLPMITDWINASSKWDSNMYEANLLVFHKSEYTRKFLKWLVNKNEKLNLNKRALLCAATQECIEPASSALYCNDHMLGLIGVCHRQDQSVFNILNVNSEYQRWSENNKGNRKKIKLK